MSRIQTAFERLQASGRQALIPYITAGDPRPAACAYRVMWEAINARRGFPWEINPWVWAVEFRPT